MRKRALFHFESFAQKVIEGGMQRLSSAGGGTLMRQITAVLAQALEDSGTHGLAASRYRISLNPTDYQQVAASLPDLASVLEDALAPLAQQAGLRLGGEPGVVVEVDDELRSGEIRAEVQPVETDETTTFDRRHVTAIRGAVQTQLEALDAFLILNGRRHIPLDKPLITIGRSIEMDVIVEASAVSRQHAHIRWRYGHFVLYDAGSRGGVTVNGERCQECVLRPGDLIMLAGQVSLIYGEGAEERRRLPEREGQREEPTQAFPPQSDG